MHPPNHTGLEDAVNDPYKENKKEDGYHFRFPQAYSMQVYVIATFTTPYE